ncbi:MAG: MnmC family methyltransferase [Planctomycetota bacterium]|nr:MnmC family methyltransferase [Planctomycetota bacterium]
MWKALLKTSSWGRVMTADGCPTLCHPEHGQSCHDSGGAWAEAQQLHVSGCDLPHRLLRGDHVRLLEVGAAPGWNLAAAYFMARGLPGQLHVTALERAPEALDAGLEMATASEWRAAAPFGAPDCLEAIHGGLRAARASDHLGQWVEITPNFRLRLFIAEASEVVAALDVDEQFDAVFLDAFSPSVDPASWSPAFLRDLTARVAPEGRLTTFTVSQGVRSALLAGGLEVGCAGARSGRSGGTWASRGGWVPPLNKRLHAKLKRRSERQQASRGLGEGCL